MANEKELISSNSDNAHFEAVLMGSRDAVLALRADRDKKNHIVDFVFVKSNSPGKKLFGLPGRVVGRRLLKVLPFSREDGLVGRLADVVKSGKPENFEQTLRIGEELMRIRITAIPRGDDVAIMAFDCTAEEIREKILNEEREQIEAANRANMSILASLSHEMRTPLNTIIGFADMMRGEMLGPMANPQYREYAEDICKEGQAMLVNLNDMLDRKRFESIKKTGKDYRHLIELAPDLISVCRDGKIVLMNPAGANMLGVWPADVLIGRNFVDFVHPLYRGIFEGGLDGLVSEQRRVSIKLVSAEGREVEVEMAALPYQEEGMESAEMLIARDVTERNRSTREVAAREERLRNIMETVADGIITIDETGVIESSNPAAETIFGYSPGELVGKKINILMPEPHSSQHDAYLATYLKTGAAKVIGMGREAEGLSKYGNAIPLEISITEHIRGKRRFFIGVVRDITERKRNEERLRYLATRDPLTGLPNRNLFRERLEKAVARTDDKGLKTAVMFADLDDFKKINDALGQPMGDLVLQAAGGRLLECVREGDTVAHLGGDEFTIILDGIKGKSEAENIARKMLARLSQPFSLEGKEIYASGSIGLVYYPDDADNITDLLKNMDTAIHHAKRLGRNNLQFYTEELSANVLRRMDIENGLRRALERDELELYYQAKVNMDTHAIIGAEALLRWRSMDLGMVSPEEFIPVAEQTGLIAHIGEWMLRNACAQGVKWVKEGLPAINLAVNLSAYQFKQKNLIDQVSNILAETGMNADNLDLEITESMLMENADETIRVFSTLKDMGLRLAIDDFGTGYSSLSYLTRFPIDTIKIDRTFVTNLPEDRDAVAIARAIVSMAQNLKLNLVAEGVETEGQEVFLHALGCNIGQGFLYSRPEPADEFARLLGGGGRVVRFPRKA
ncbi:MAG TPA: EAL domain-containing protein [Rhodospirillales bacterium]|nr:EAL domain-containing protein [Rhodospirillales bacterium]